MIEIIDCETFQALCYRIIKKISSGDRESEDLRELFDIVTQHRDECRSCNQLLLRKSLARKKKGEGRPLGRLNEWLRAYQELFGVSDVELGKLLTNRMLEIERTKRKKKNPSS